MHPEASSNGGGWNKQGFKVNNRVAGINGSGKSFKINKQVAEKLNKVDIRKLEIRKLQRYNDNIHWTALSAQRKKQSKILLTV